jgi:hypothetical protein
MSDNTAPRAEDKVNTYAIVVVGLVGALLTYVSIVALQAYYASSIGAEESVKDVAGLGADYQSLKVEQSIAMSEYGRAGDKIRLPIERAKELVLEDARNRASTLVPAVGEHDTPTVDPATGKPIGAPDTPAPGEDGAPAPGGEGTTPTDAAGGTSPEGTPGGGPMDTEGTPPPADGAAPAGDQTEPAPAGDAPDRSPPATPAPGGNAPTP